MPQTATKLGKRLRRMRLARGKSQDAVARELGISRSTVAQMELGNRAIKADDIERMAEVFGCSVQTLLSSPDTEEEEAREGGEALLEDLFRQLPRLAATRRGVVEVRRAVDVARTMTELESKLGLPISASHPPTYRVPSATTTWEAVEQGYATAEEERRRMSLGEGAIRDVEELLAVELVRATAADLRASVSSLYVRTAETGVLVIVNRRLSAPRRRFHLLHGYAHAVFDREDRWLICRPQDFHAFPELRANAFAGRFLLPKLGLQRLLRSLGKDTLGRSDGAVLKLYAEPRDVVVDGRGRRGTTPINPCELSQVASHFGVSRSLAASSLRNLRYINDDELGELDPPDGAVPGTIREALGLPPPRAEAPGATLRSRLVCLAVEGLCRGLLDLARFDDIALQVRLRRSERRALLAGIAHREGMKVSRLTDDRRHPR